MADSYRQAGIRLKEDVDPTLAEHFDPGPWETIKAGVPGFHMFDKAHCVMLTEEKLIPRAPAQKILLGLRQMEKEGMLEARRSVSGSKHSGELWLTKRYGEEVAGWLHVGRSSGDLGAVSDCIAGREAVLRILGRVLTLRSTLLELAAPHLETVLPGYSHLQHAQPLTLAFYYHSWDEALRRDCERLLAAYGRMNRSPAGAAIMTGSDFPLNRERVAALLGFDEVLTNNHDAIFHQDALAEAASAITILMSNVARIADDIHLWASNEFAMVDVADRYCVSSSIMPQKKNPWSTQYARGQYARVLGRTTSIFGLIKTLQDQIEPHYMIGWELAELVDHADPAIEVMDGTLRSMGINKALMAERAGMYWATASDLASALVRERELPWRTAHKIVAILVRLATERGIAPKAVTPALLDEASNAYIQKPLKLPAESLRRALDPLEFVKARTLVGGPAPATLAKELERAAKRLAADQEAHASARKRLDDAAAKLEGAIDAIVEAK
jgi:argininosuccinate lyase